MDAPEHRGRPVGLPVRLARLVATTVALWIPTAAPAQRPAWKLPPRGAAEYRRTSERLTVAAPAVDPRAGIRHVVRRAADGGDGWRYRISEGTGPTDDWTSPDYDDSGWRVGRTPFADRGTGTRWPANAPTLDVRTTFELGRRRARGAVLWITHDDLATVRLNGLEIYRGRKYVRDHVVALDEVAVDAFESGENVLTVRVRNTGGAAAFDLGLTVCDRSFSEPRRAIDLIRARLGEGAAIGRRMVPAFRAPPFLCAGQLDDDRQTITAPPIDIRDVGPFLALDLDGGTASHGTRGRIPRTFQFGDLVWRGRADAADSSGLQRIEIDLRSDEPRAAGEDPDFVERHLLPRFVRELDATLTIERRLTEDEGAVAWFRYELLGELHPRRGNLADRTFHLRFAEEWTLEAIRENRDDRFRSDVVDAIRRGAEKLRKEIRNPGARTLRNQARGNRTYNSGRLALALLALLHAEVPHDDPVVAKGLAELRRRRFHDTYSTAHAIMALEKYYTPRGEIEELRAGRIDRPRERQPSEADRKLLQEWTGILLRNIDTRVDRSYLLRFNYDRGPRYDHSVNQYGLLGLYSAHLCGIEISPTVWEAAANHLIDAQSEPLGRHRLKLTNHQQWEDERRGGTVSAGARPTLIAGWAYQGPSSRNVPVPLYGSMTCAGIAGLTICQAGLRDTGVTRTRLIGEADQAIRFGFAWLSRNFTVHSNAGRYQQPYYWVYYYLYGLERACELGGIALIDDRDWYYEGALTLLANQRADGGWPDDLHPDEELERTAMAVLFLKKASMPVYTRR